MSFTCEECRKKQGLAHGLGYPFFGSYGRCEDCGKTAVCEDLHGVTIPGIPWYHCLTAHALIHAGMVLLITRNYTFAVCEFVIHFWTDFAKCDGKIDFQEDQFIHYSCKLLWGLL